MAPAAFPHLIRDTFSNTFQAQYVYDHRRVMNSNVMLKYEDGTQDVILTSSCVIPVIKQNAVYRL